MKHVWKMLMAALLALALLLSVTGAVAEEADTVYGVCTGDGVRVRKQPSTSANVWFSVDEGHVAQILEERTDSDGNVVWYKVNSPHPTPNGRTYIGYIAADYFRVMTAEETEAYLEENATPVPSEDPTPTPAAEQTLQPSTDDALEDAAHVEYSGTEVVGAKGKVTSNANFRSQPTTQAGKVICVIPAGTEVDVNAVPLAEDAENGWYRIWYQDQSGYVHASLLELTDPGEKTDKITATGITTASGVNFRTGPSTSYSSMGKLASNVVVELLSIPDKIDEDHWYNVRYNGKTGYVQSLFIRVLTVDESDLPDEQKYGYASLLVNSVNLRETPGGTTATQWTGKGSLMRIVGEPVTKGAYNWYPVYYASTSSIYYVRDDMVEVMLVQDGQIVTPTPAPGSTYGYVITTENGVNLRIQPFEDSIAQVPRNTVLACVGEPEKPDNSDYWWYKVKYNGMTGYLRGDCVRVCTATGGDITATPTPEPTQDPSTSTTIYGYVKITTKSGARAHLRNQPQGDSLALLPNGLILPVMGEAAPSGKYFWYPVRTADGLNGYIRGDLLTLCDEQGNEVEETPAPDSSTETELVGATGKILKNSNLRKGASTGSDVITVIPANTVVSVLVVPSDTSNGWYKVVYGGETGYVHASLIEMVSMGDNQTEEPSQSAFGYVIITGSKVNVRQTPGGTTLTKVVEGDVLPIIGVSITRTDGTWINVRADGYAGYVHSDYAVKLTPEQEESYLAGNGVPEVTPVPEDVASSYLMTTGSTLNVRETYSADSTAVFTVPKGTVMKFFSTKQIGTVTWYCVLCNDLELWVHGGYVDELSMAEYLAWAAANPDLVPDANANLGYLKTVKNNVYIRNAADGSTPIDQVTKGTVMRYYSDLIPAGGYNWYRVTTADGEFGYIRSDMVEKCDENGDELPIPTPDLGDLSSAPQSEQETSYTKLKEGDGGDGTTKGPKVANLVQELINQGYYTGKVTNVYTSDVTAAVKAFQTVKGLDVDGIAGSATQHALFGTRPYGAGDTDNLDFTIYPAEKIDWFTGGIQDMLPKGCNFKVYDVKTGVVWWAHRWSGAYHADIETLTAADTKRLCDIYGVDDAQDIYDNNLWQRRPCLVTIGTRTFACSLDGMPHNPDGDTIDDNNMTGQICLHFTNSTSHGDPPVVSTTHAEAIDYAYNHCPAGNK